MAWLEAERMTRGSSPRVRGTLAHAREIVMQPRFIPACAGNTPLAGTRSSSAAVHPRVCGEHLLGVGVWAVTDGSSPRVRGTHAGYSPDRGWNRFIPACAGNTSVTLFDRVGHSVHPRVCGEHHLPMLKKEVLGGSSPRVRGTRLQPTGVAAVGRFIPACAGNTPCPSC